MRTQALRVSVGAYSDGTWHVATIVDYYERGVLINSQVDTIRHFATMREVRAAVELELDAIERLERDRVMSAAGSGPGPVVLPAAPR